MILPVFMMVVSTWGFGKPDPICLSFLTYNRLLSALTSSLNEKSNKVEGVLFNNAIPANVMQVLQYLHLGEFHHKMREERRGHRTENKTGDGVHEQLVS